MIARGILKKIRSVLAITSSCVDVKDMLCNLSSHMNYMRTSLTFILRQLKSDDEILKKGVQASGGIEAIIHEV